MFLALGVILLCSTAGLQAEATGDTSTQAILAELHLRQQLPSQRWRTAVRKNASALRLLAVACASSCPSHTRLGLSVAAVVYL